MEDKKWYINQKVWDKTVSDEDGEIKSITDNVEHPIRVDFKISEFVNYIEYYTLDGVKIHRKLPTLSTKPYEIIMEGFSQEVEEELPKKGQLVYGSKIEGGLWEYGYFIRKNEDGKYELSSKKDSNIGVDFCQITTKNPYEVDQEVFKMETTDREPKVGDVCFFWDYENPIFVICGKLLNIGKNVALPYKMANGAVFHYCSLKNPLIK